jgi:hypothetical protein
MKELQYLMPDKETYVRNYGDGGLYKPRGIWWLGRNRFIRITASVASHGRGGGSIKDGASSALREVNDRQAYKEAERLRLFRLINKLNK